VPGNVPVVFRGVHGAGEHVEGEVEDAVVEELQVLVRSGGDV
jgi:hypothetical protein